MKTIFNIIKYGFLLIIIVGIFQSCFHDDESSKKEEPAPPQLDMAAINTEFQKELMDKRYYPLVQDVTAEIDKNNKDTINLVAIVSPAMNTSATVDLADTMLRRFNAIAQMHDDTIKSPSKDYYGSVFDSYVARIIIAPSTAQTPDDAFVYTIIGKGLHTKKKIVDTRTEK